MDGTLLTLKGSDGSNQGVEWIGSDSGYVFERRRWRRTPEAGRRGPADSVPSRINSSRLQFPPVPPQRRWTALPRG